MIKTACVVLGVAFAGVGFAQSQDQDTGSQEAKAETGPQAPALDVAKMPFSRRSIARVMDSNQDKVQSCYEETLATLDKPIQGKLVTSFVITAEGLVKGAKVEKKGTTLKDPKLHDCIVAVLTAMTFPKPPDKKDHPVEYPFNLKPLK
jgi:hypothetical protein